MRFSPILIGIALAASLAACSKSNEVDEEAADFQPPTAQTRDDYARNLDRRFARTDRNSDGAIQAEEMQRRRGGAATGNDGTGGTTPPPRNGGGGRAAMLKALDADGDGEVTRGEFISGSLARFDKADANQDKTLTSDERRASGLFGGRNGDRPAN